MIEIEGLAIIRKPTDGKFIGFLSDNWQWLWTAIVLPWKLRKRGKK